jgi:hypothetical protein
MSQTALLERPRQQEQERLAEKLMAAYHIALILCDPKKVLVISSWVKEMTLPPKQCRRCRTNLTFFHYHSTLGYCPQCIEEIVKETRIPYCTVPLGGQ